MAFSRPALCDRNEPLMKSRIAFGLVIVSFLAAPIGGHAQLRSLLKKKAADIIKGKPAAPAPVDEGKKSEPTPTPTPTSGATAPAKAEPKVQVSPLETSELNLPSKANQTLRGEMPVQSSGDWEGLPYISQKTVAAAKALGEPARVAFVENVGAAFKTLVMSDTFAKAHGDYIKQEHKAVDHGIKGLVSEEELQRRNNIPAWRAAMQRESAVAIVDTVETMSPDQIQTRLADDMKGWSRRAADVKRKDRAKYEKFVRDGQALVQLGTSDPQKLRRGYAVLRSVDDDGPDTEEALYALREKVTLEKEQTAWDDHNLKAVLKKQLTAFVALVPTVDFAAATADKGGMTRFVKPAYESKGAVWKACFRAGKGPTMAALQIAQAWLKEL